VSTELVEVPTIEHALEIVGSREVTIEDRGAAYALLHQIQLRINRVLRTAKDDLIVHLESNHLKALGPLSIKATAIDARYIVNDEGNWQDAGVQDELATLAKVAPDYIRRVPEHYEIRTAELGQGVHNADPVARKLWTIAKERGWRIEEGRRLSLAVREPTKAREA